jgi:hypothetical protein
MGRWIRNYGNMCGGGRSEVIVTRETVAVWMILPFTLDTLRLHAAETWRQPSRFQV